MLRLELCKEGEREDKGKHEHGGCEQENEPSADILQHIRGKDRSYMVVCVPKSEQRLLGMRLSQNKAPATLASEPDALSQPIITPCSTCSNSFENMEMTIAQADEKPTLAHPTATRNRGRSTCSYVSQNNIQNHEKKDQHAGEKKYVVVKWIIDE